jgi:hypothetical protein
MAYGNWGAKIYRDDVAMHDNCDTTILRLLAGKPKYAVYLQHYLEKATAGDLYHGIIGDKEAGVFVCLYKSYVPEIINAETMENDRAASDALIAKWDDYEADDRKCVVTVNDVEITIDFQSDPESVSCRFSGKDGAAWSGASGYEMGEGHEEWD